MPIYQNCNYLLPTYLPCTLFECYQYPSPPTVFINNPTHSLFSLVILFLPFQFIHTSTNTNNKFTTTQTQTQRDPILISHSSKDMAPSFDISSHTVCVMDASSQLGLSLVQRLLQRGYTVHASLQKYGMLINSLIAKLISTSFFCLIGSFLISMV